MRATYSPEALPPDFADAVARERHRFGRLGSQVLFFSTIESTNDVAATLASGGHEGAVVLAERQTAGRGRRGRSWFSPSSAGLYVSVVVKPGRSKRDPERATTLTTLAAGVALAEAVQRATGLAPDIKWPNDLVVGGRKLAGILAEAVDGGIVLGYGINVASVAFPSELAKRATSLEGELGRPIDRATLCVETLAFLAMRYDDLLEGRFDAILHAWRARAPASAGTRVRWDAAGSALTGLTAGIDDSGALLVQVGSRTERVIAGEVHWLDDTCS